MDSDGELLLRLRSGDERAFVSLVERYHEPMLRLAASFVPSGAVAEEVVQDTWLAVLRGLDNFEGRSSLKTWLFRILVNRARSTGSREQRSVPVADPEPAVDPSRFAGGGWADPPEHWIEAAESRMEAGKLADRIRVWIGELPARQREVVLLRRPARIRGPDPADEGGVHRPLPPVAVRAAVTRVRAWCHRDRQPS